MTEAVTEQDISWRQQRYRQLLQQPDELWQLAQASSLADFCAVLAICLQWPALSVDNHAGIFAATESEVFTARTGIV